MHSELFDIQCRKQCTVYARQHSTFDHGPLHTGLLEKVPQDLFHSVYFEYEENSTHDRLLSLNYAFCHIKRFIKTSEPVYTD